MTTRISIFTMDGLNVSTLQTLGEGMSCELFGRTTTSGFIIDKRSKKNIEGRYIRKISTVTQHIDPFGEPFETASLDFVEQHFVLSICKPHLILFNPTSSARPMIGRLSEFSHFSISVSPVKLELDRLFCQFTERFDNVRAYAAYVQGIELSSTAMVQLRFQASDDVRTHVRKFLGNRTPIFESLKVEFTYSDVRRRASLSCDGVIQLYGEYDPTLRDAVLDAISAVVR